MRLALLLVGYGHVARRFTHLLDEMRTPLDALDIEPVVVGVVTRRGGDFAESRVLPVRFVPMTGKVRR